MSIRGALEWADNATDTAERRMRMDMIKTKQMQYFIEVEPINKEIARLEMIYRPPGHILIGGSDEIPRVIQSDLPEDVQKIIDQFEEMKRIIHSKIMESVLW